MRGKEVIAPVRDRRRTGDLADYGVSVIEDDLSDPRSLAELLGDIDDVVHVAGSYRVGITREERGAMWDANIGTTTRVLDAAELAGTPRIVYVSTVGYFGNSRGRVVDESYRRDVRDGFLSWYDETKFGAHEVARQRIAAGAPVIIVMPSQVYGPGDPSQVGEQLRAAHDGQLRYRVLEEVGFGWVHVDDLAVGIIAALERGAPGESYVLSGPRHRLGEAIETAARLGGRRPPRAVIPTGLLSIAASIGGRVGRTGLRELVSSGAGVTYWASSEKAARELDFSPRALEDGLRDTFSPPVV
jgi:dihydroflavonol-4-reductase